MQTNDIEVILSSYRKGLREDIIQAGSAGKWGHIWTIRPCSPAAMEQAGKQFTRARSPHLRHIRYARLKNLGRDIQDAIIITILPDRSQNVVSLKDGTPLDVASYLEDDSLSALARSFMASHEQL